MPDVDLSNLPVPGPAIDLSNLPVQDDKPVNPELHRTDNAIFSINTNPMNNWIADKASHLPNVNIPNYLSQMYGEKDQTLPGLAAEIGSAAINVPSAILEGIFGAPESPALMGAGALKGNLSKIADSTIKPPIPTPEVPKLEIPVQQPKLLPPATSQHQLPFRLGDTGQINLGTGKPTELLQPNSRLPIGEVPNTAQSISQHLDTNPAIKNGDLPKPPVDTAIGNRPPTKPSDMVIPGPGQAEPLTPFRANFNSPNKVGMKYESTRPIVEAIVSAKDAKEAWIGSTNRELLATTKGLDKNGRLALWNELRAPGSTNDPNILQRTKQAHEILDSIFKEASDAGSDIHYMKDYITEIQKQPEGIKDGIKSIFNFHGMGDLFREVESDATGKLGDYFEKGLGHPSSVFTRERTGNIRQLEMDPNKIFPIYVDSIAKVIHDAPAVDIATAQLKNVPEGPLKELMTSYIKNYTNYDSEPELHSAWQKFSNGVAAISARSFLGLNPGIHMLHLGEIPANIYPELGGNYLAKGIMSVATKPIENFREMSRLGLLQGEIKPFSFKTPGEKLDSIMNYMGVVESVVKGSAYNGFKQKFLDMGMNESQATMKALNEAKNATMTVDAARRMKGFTSESNFIGGEYGARNTMQFKQIPAKIVEQYYDIATQFMQDKKKFARAAFGATVAAGGALAGLHTSHTSSLKRLVDPLGMAQSTMLGGLNDVTIKVLTDLSKGDIGKALMDTATWMTPGGTTIKKLVSENESPKRLQFTA